MLVFSLVLSWMLFRPSSAPASLHVTNEKPCGSGLPWATCVAIAQLLVQKLSQPLALQSYSSLEHSSPSDRGAANFGGILLVYSVYFSLIVWVVYEVAFL